MKQEQIEALRVYAEQYVIGGTDRLDQSVLRLLAEREALLGALRLEPHCCGQAGVKELHKIREAALALAES